MIEGIVMPPIIIFTYNVFCDTMLAPYQCISTLGHINSECLIFLGIAITHTKPKVRGMIELHFAYDIQFELMGGDRQSGM